MSPREALEAVGLASLDGVTADSLRRAYLRKLREHPPERDPDGFARLRTAFELLRGALAVDEAVAAGRARIVVAPASPGKPARAVVIPVVGAPTQDPIERPTPVPTEPRPAPPMRLGELVPRLLALLLAGKADEAVELEAAWRADGGDDCRMIGPGEAARWLFVRELVGVARELPEGVRHPLARAVRDGDFRGARAALEDFPRHGREAAMLADGALQRRAPTIYAHVRGCLVPLPRTSKGNAPVIKRGDAWPIIRVVLGVLVVLAAVASQQRGHSSRPADLPAPHEVQLSPEVQRAMQAASEATANPPALTAPAALPAPQPVAPPDEDPNIADVEAQCLLIEDHAQPASTAQRAAAAAMRTAIFYSCDARSGALHDLEHAAALPDRDDRAMAAGAIRLIEADVDALCPGAAPATKEPSK